MRARHYVLCACLTVSAFLLGNINKNKALIDSETEYVKLLTEYNEAKHQHNVDLERWTEATKEYDKHIKWCQATIVKLHMDRRK